MSFIPYDVVEIKDQNNVLIGYDYFQDGLIRAKERFADDTVEVARIINDQLAGFELQSKHNWWRNLFFQIGRETLMELALYLLGENQHPHPVQAAAKLEQLAAGTQNQKLRAFLFATVLSFQGQVPGDTN